MTADTPVTAAQAKKVAKPKKPANHPTYSEMVVQAIGKLKERGGSSRQAILKYIQRTFNVGFEEKSINAYLKQALKAGVKKGTLLQSKGTGASGSFRLGEKPKVKKTVKPKKVTTPKKAVKKPAVKKATTTKPKAVKSPAKKPKSPKKPAAKPKKPVTAKSKKPAVAKSEKPTAAKSKKATAAKPKSASPKKVSKKASVKKTVAKK